jgi:hypothetical protein
MDTGLVFLCGFPSSGTDLLKNVINAHPDVCINGEFPFLHQLAHTYGATVAAEQADEVIATLRHIDVYHNFGNPNPRLKPGRIEYCVADIYAAMLTDKPRRWQGNKTPQNTEHIDVLRVLFPKAKFIVIIRDVRDVALSWSNKWGKHRVLCAAKWNARMLRGARLLKELDGDDFLVIKYEALLSDLENTARQICDFLQIEYCDSMIEFHQRVHRIVDGKLNYGKALIRDNANKWTAELSSKEIRRIEEVAFQALKAFDYPISLATAERPLRKWEKYIGFIWDLGALIFIGNRAIEGNRFVDRWKTIVFEIRKLASGLLHRASSMPPVPRGKDDGTARYSKSSPS